MINEPGKLKLAVATRSLWSTFIMGYKNEALIKRLSESVAEHHQYLDMNDVVSVLKAYTYFDHLDMAARDGLVKTSIRNSEHYNFKSLASICDSLARLNYHNQTLLNIVRRMILQYEEQGKLHYLVKGNSSAPIEDETSLEPAGPFQPVKRENYLQPLQCAQLMYAFS